MLTGEDSEGEEININKIDEALRTVGISLKDFLNGSKGMDDIFLELASKWDSLDLATQRYIATAAAGSRQQSRFIAMMSNYGRTMELVDAANNSAGASQEQYAKTLESLETKLQQLKNAWDTFAMGLANDETIKVAVDTLTWILEKINLIIEKVSGGNGMIKSLTSLGAAFGVLKVGGTAFEALFGTVAKAASEGGLGAGETFSSVFQSSLKEKFGKSGEYFKKLFPSRKQWKTLVGQDLTAAFAFDFNNASSGQIKHFGESIWKDFETSLIGQKIKLTELDRLKKEFFEGFESGNAEKSLQNLAEKADELKVNFKLSKDSAKATAATIESDFGKASVAVAGVSLALTGVTKRLESTGHERGAEGFEALASGASVLAAILTILPGLLKTFGVAASAAGPIGWAIAAITTLISLGVALSKWIETGAEKLERLNKETKEAADAANEAKQAYEDLLSKKSEYSGLQKELEDLTKGTDEWKQKLIETNNEVLTLLDAYPELIDYIKRGEEGQLTITEEGWDRVIDNKLTQSQSAVLSSLAHKIQLSEEESAQAKNMLAGSLFGAANPYNTEDRVNALIEAYKETPDLFTEQSKSQLTAETFFKELDKARDQDDEARLEELYKIFNTSEIGQRYHGQLASYEADYAQGRFASIDQYSPELQELASQTTLTIKEIQDSFSAIGKYVEQEAAGQEQRKNTVASMIIAGSDSASNEKFANQLAHGLANATLELSTDAWQNDSLESLRDKYYKEFGLEANEKWSAERIREELALTTATKTLTTLFENLTYKLNKLPLERASEYARILSFDTGEIVAGQSQLTENELFTLLRDVDALEGEAFVTLAQGYGIDTEGKTYKAIRDELLTLINEIIRLGVKEIEDTKKETNDLLGDDYFNAEYLKGATNAQISAYASLLKQSFGALGAEGAGITGVFDEIMTGANEEQRQKIWDYISAADFQSEGAGEDFVDFLKGLGVITPDLNNKMGNFITDLKQLSKGFERIDLSKIINNIKELLDLSDDFLEREESQGLTQEEYDKVIAANIEGVGTEDFFWTGQEWSYLGGSMEDLAKAIKENTNAVLDEDLAAIEKQVASGMEMERIAQDWSNSEFTKEQFLAGEVTDYDVLRNILEMDANASYAQIDWKYQQMLHAWQNLVSNQEKQKEYEAKGVTTELFHTDTAILGANEKTELTTEALKAQADSYNISKEAIEAYKQALIAAGFEDTKAEKRAIELAIQHTKLQKSIDDSADSLKDYAEILKAADKDSIEYKTAMSEAVGAINKIFGTDLDLEGVNENFAGLLESWMNGSEDAFIKIREMFGASLKDNLKNANIDFAQLETQLAKFDFSVVGEVQLDNSGFLRDIVISEEHLTNFINYLKSAHGIQVTMKQKEDGTGFIVDTLSKMDNFIPTGSRSSSGGSSSKWENPYDKLHNVVQRINAELRTRERLERQYQRILENEVASSAEIAENARKQIESLEYEKRTREYLKAKREEELAMIREEYNDVSNYATWDDTLGVILNQEALAALNGSSDTKLTERVDKYIEQMQEKFDQIQEEIDSIDEIEDIIKDIKKQGEEEYFNFEDEIKQALINERQEEIDKLTEINDSINNSNTKIIESMQKSIDAQRQTRENAKTEKELEEKRQRLLQLQMDTSGANDLEIMALEEELAEEEQSFIDTLVDQKIQQLQDQNQEAYEQRQYQIELMQDQLRIWEKSGDIWTEVNSIFRDGFDSLTGEIDPNSKLMQMLKASSDFDSKSQAAQEKWLEELNQTLTQALGYLEMNQQLEDIGMKAGTSIEFYYNGEKLEGIVDENGNVVTADDKVYNNVYKGLGGYYAGENINEQRKEVEEEKLYKNNSGDKNGSAGSGSKYKSELSQDQIKQVQNELNALGYNAGAADGIYGKNTMNAINRLQGKPEGTEQILTAYVANQIHELFLKEHGIFEPESRKLFPGYATGGLADFTGPAWLDGTKAKPEYVLNAAQTERFFTLVDILDSLKGFENGKSIQNSGDNIVDIDINIDTVKEEADVDMLAEKVQRAIVTSAQYRNNNFVRR